MIDKNFLITFVGLTIAVVAILSINSSGNVVENFWSGPSFNVKTLPPLIKKNEKIRDFGIPFVAVTNRQPNLTPRFDNSQAARATKMGARKPLDFESGIPKVAEQKSGYDQSYTENFEDPSAPIGDMTQPDMLSQPIIYNRLIYANKNSRTRSKGDQIRGDLAIAPTQTGWFQVAANPTLDLQQGALNVMAGVNEQGSRMAQFMKQTSNGAVNTVAGVNTNQFGTTFSAGGAVNVSSR